MDDPKATRPDRVIAAPALTAFAARVLAAGGSGPEEAKIVADNLVLANLSGHDSHGVGMLPRYVASLEAGGLRPNRHARLELDAGTLLRFDGECGYGQVVGSEAIAVGVDRARTHGVAVVALHHAHHLGRIGHFAEACLSERMLSLHFVNVVVRPIVAAFGGLDARTGTNPVCVGIPRAEGEDVLLDFATSRIAQGKTRVAHNRGERVAEGMLIDPEGRPSTDPRHAVQPPFGALLPFGEHKGFGLAVVAELLGGALAGGPTCHEEHPGNRQILNGMFSVIVDVKRLGTRESFERQASAYLGWLKASRTADGSPVTLPGEPEAARRVERARAGVAVDATTWDEIVAAAGRLGLGADECERLAGA